MAGVFRPHKALNQKAMELEAAREILAEVFGVRLWEVDEMIQSRFEAEDRCSKGLWPQEFWVEW